MSEGVKKYSEFGKRLDSLRENKERKKAFALRIGVHPNMLSVYLRDRVPAQGILLKISEETKVSIDWLLTGHGEKYHGASNPQDLAGLKAQDLAGLTVDENQAKAPSSGYVQVPLLDGRVTAGPDGGILMEEPIDFYPFKEAWVRARGWGAKDRRGALYLIRVQGDSMVPTINAGELILIDTWPAERQEIRNSRIYLVRMPDATLTLKRVVLNEAPAGPRLVLISDNPANAPFEFALEEGRSLHWYIIGRVRWLGREFD